MTDGQVTKDVDACKKLLSLWTTAFGQNTNYTKSIVLDPLPAVKIGSMQSRRRPAYQNSLQSASAQMTSMVSCCCAASHKSPGAEEASTIVNSTRPKIALPQHGSEQPAPEPALHIPGK